MFNTTDILDIALRIEKNGETVCREAIGQVNDAAFADLLQEMVAEEENHYRQFLEMKQAAAHPDANPFAARMSREAFDDIIGDQSFSLKTVDFTALADLDALIAVLIEFEQDTILFYEMLQPFIEEAATLDTLAQIIAEENRHIQRLGSFVGRDILLPSETPE